MPSPAARLAHLLEPLGPFSPFAPLGADSPGARALLGATERAAERALHVARAAVFAIVFAVFFLAAPHLPTPLVAIGVLGFPIASWLWVVVWRALGTPSPPGWLPYVLIFVDAWLALRGAISVQTPLYRMLGADRFLTPAELAAATGPMLAVVAMTGGLRLNVALARYSTFLALASYGYVALALDVGGTQALLTGGMIGLMGCLGIQVARVFRHTMLKAREEAILERYVPEALVQELARSGADAGAGREVEITVVIVDIRDYTRRAEHLSPRQAVAFLNDYFSVVVAPLAAEGAVLDKYIGDGVFAFLEGPEHQRRGLRAAHAILQAIDAYNRNHPAAEPLAIGIALHAGRALVGSIGAVQKREYTAIADTVNLAARLEELNKRFGSRVIASEAVLGAVDPPERGGFVGPELIELRGHDAPLAVSHLP